MKVPLYRIFPAGTFHGPGRVTRAGREPRELPFCGRFGALSSTESFIASGTGGYVAEDHVRR